MSCGATLTEGQPASAPTNPSVNVAPQPPPFVEPPRAAPMAQVTSPVIAASLRQAQPTSTAKGIRWHAGQDRVISNLGARIDGWADLLDGMGERADELATEFQDRMSKRALPNIRLETTTLIASSTSGDRRPYFLAATQTGATTTVRIGKFGTDLYLAWDLYVRPLINPIVILAILGLAFLFSSGALDSGMFAVPVFLVSIIFHCFWMSAVVGFAGRVFRGSWLGFFFKEVTPFDANDISAMNLAVHHSLLQAADVVGIDIHQLRAKELFRSGDRNRLF